MIHHQDVATGFADIGGVRAGGRSLSGQVQSGFFEQEANQRFPQEAIINEQKDTDGISIL